PTSSGELSRSSTLSPATRAAWTSCGVRSGENRAGRILMEKMPYQPGSTPDEAVSTCRAADVAPVPSGWRGGLPTLSGTLVALRELRLEDAASLYEALTTEDASRFISPPPASPQGFEKFIAWTHGQRVAGRYACFAVVLRGSDAAIGLFQIRSLDPSF